MYAVNSDSLMSESHLHENLIVTNLAHQHHIKSRTQDNLILSNHALPHNIINGIELYNKQLLK